MTIREAIEEANRNAGIPKAYLADIGEFNRFFNSGQSDQYPVNVTVPFSTNGTTVNGRRRAVVPLQGWILTQLKQAPEDYRSYEIERDYLEPMRKVAKKFIKELLNSEIVDAEAIDRGVTDSIKPEYMFTNSLLFGVSYTLNLPIIDSVC